MYDTSEDTKLVYVYSNWTAFCSQVKIDRTAFRGQVKIHGSILVIISV